MKYLNTQEAADYIGAGTNPRTVVTWMKDGKLRHVRNPSKRGRYKTTTEWIDECLQAGVDAGQPAGPVFFEAPAEALAVLEDAQIRASE